MVFKGKMETFARVALRHALQRFTVASPEDPDVLKNAIDVNVSVKTLFQDQCEKAEKILQEPVKMFENTRNPYFRYSLTEAEKMYFRASNAAPALRALMGLKAAEVQDLLFRARTLEMHSGGFVVWTMHFKKGTEVRNSFLRMDIEAFLLAYKSLQRREEYLSNFSYWWPPSWF